MDSSDEIFFDSEGHPVPVDEIDFDAMDERLALASGKKPSDAGHNIYDRERRAVQGEEVIRLFKEKVQLELLEDLLADDPTPNEIFRYAVLRHHLLKPEKTHADLAIKLGITRPRVTQILTKLQGETAIN